MDSGGSDGEGRLLGKHREGAKGERFRLDFAQFSVHSPCFMFIALLQEVHFLANPCKSIRFFL